MCITLHSPFQKRKLHGCYLYTQLCISLWITHLGVHRLFLLALSQAITHMITGTYQQLYTGLSTVLKVIFFSNRDQIGSFETKLALLALDAFDYFGHLVVNVVTLTHHL